MAGYRSTKAGRSRLYWLGDEVKRRVEAAAVRAVDRTTADGAEYARQNHPGWKSITGTAEGSINVAPARVLGRRIRGSIRAGGGDAFYLLILEVKKGSALRNAADVTFPQVQPRLAQEFAIGGGRALPGGSEEL